MYNYLSCHYKLIALPRSNRFSSVRYSLFFLPFVLAVLVCEVPCPDADLTHGISVSCTFFRCVRGLRCAAEPVVFSAPEVEIHRTFVSIDHFSILPRFRGCKRTIETVKTEIHRSNKLATILIKQLMIGVSDSAKAV